MSPGPTITNSNPNAHQSDRIPSAPPRLGTSSHHDNQNTLKSPCFVHSRLDQGLSFGDWLKQKSGKQGGSGGVGVAKSLQSPAMGAFQKHPQRPHPARSLTNGHLPIHGAYPDGTRSDDNSVFEDEDDEDRDMSLTRQLAETAVGVREMSKQLGRARIHSIIHSVLIVTKARDNRLIKLTRELAVYLMSKKTDNGRGLIVYVDNQLRTSRRFDAAGIERDHPEFFVPFPRRRTSTSSSSSSSNSNGSSPPGDAAFPKDEGQLRYWTAEMCSRSPHLFDFVVTLGGDGTVLFTSWLFQRIVPPVLPFALGSLGFLTNFDFAEHQSVMDSVIDSGIRVNLRMRFTCTVYRAVAPDKGRQRKAIKKADTGEILMRNLEKGGWEAIEGGWSHITPDGKEEGKKKDKEIMCFSTRPVESFEVLNDLVVDRGPSPYVSLLELFGDEHHLTTVQADGLTISTPTGSTAYSMSAGGSLVHPEIPAILITPLCPHTLSFRPMLVPDSMEVRICVPFNSRSTAWASFDGRGRVELKQGDHIKVTASKYPFPTVCADKQSTDWFHAISRTLKWNERERQKSFVVVEESPAQAQSRSISKPSTVGSSGKPEPSPVQEDDECDEEEEDTEDFDIRDLSEDNTDAEEEKSDGEPQVKVENALEPGEKKIAREKAKEDAVEQAAAEAAAQALSKGNPFMSPSSSRSGVHSGVETPDRFSGPVPHPPPVHSRHVQFQSPPAASDVVGARDYIHSPTSELTSGKSKIPRDRDVEEMKTPTVAEMRRGVQNGHQHHHHHHHDTSQRSRSRSRDAGHRAFAVWGQDESDTSSNASDASDLEE
ncbi:ATP-NAD kinase [Gloeophyllum trabeum ATCC 11539]|uniref:ATP-NAD kinase n=1 Tax=Gloeophyllum trabeum (strain ATCC 11539 / FP-39264 / Madison 617) TaxID=670483 RepID=S7QCF6_GLOTA|nr:ATP-NAD kinase [Gloeophyllum trabeum ATCC 11539]EPQ57561.1 ATP-NAD kinase [Gloeophyllum trabeum ATCC 11539]